MSTYVNKEAYIADLMQKYDNAHVYTNDKDVERRRKMFVEYRAHLHFAMLSVERAPAAKVQEVVEAYNITDKHPVDEFICSHCGIIIEDCNSYDTEQDVYREFEYNYCPNCGAKILKEE